MNDIVNYKNLKKGRYRHFKGGEYELLFVGRDSETLKATVVYKSLYGDGGIWVRPAHMWEETVEFQGVQKKRFEYIGE